MPSPANIYRFGSFELRPRTRELYKNGIKLRLRPQPLRILEVLLDRRGDVVTRDELHQLLWKSETFVDFEQGLNTAIKELRSALSDSAEAPRYVETVPRLGYRIIVHVDVETAPLPEHVPSPIQGSTSPVQPIPMPEQASRSRDASSPAATAQSSPVPEPQPPRSRLLLSLRWTGVAAIAAIALIAFTVYRSSTRKGAAAQPPVGRFMLAVLPFDNLTGDANQEYFSDGLTEEMISQLGRIDPQRMGVIARTSVMHYKRNPTPLDQVGRQLGVGYVLEGSVRRDADTVRVSAQLIQVKDQTHLWSRQYDRQLTDLLAVQREIAQEVADEIQLTLGDKRLAANPAARSALNASRPALSPASYETYDLYLKGRFFWNKRTPEGLRQAADYFQQAIDKDSNYAPAYAALGDTLALLSTWNYVPSKDFVPKARAATLKALQLDDTLAEGHASLALIAEQYDYDWQTAEKEFRRAIELDPAYATGHQWYAECLSFEGRFDEASAESERARQLDPLSIIIATDHAMILYYSRQYDRAIEQFRAVREMEPNSPRSGLIMNAYVEAGKSAEALAEVQGFVNQHQIDSTEALANRIYVYGRSGRRPEANRAFTKFQAEIKEHPPKDRVLSWMLLYADLGTGRNEEAIALLEKECDDHTNALVGIKVDPMLDPLRSSPRFQALLARAHFAP